MGLHTKILSWVLIVSVSVSSAYQAMITCSKDGCKISPQLDSENRSSYTSELVDDLEKILTKKFEVLESNIMNIVFDEIRNSSEIITDNCKRAVIESGVTKQTDTQITTSKMGKTSVRTATPISTLPSDCWDIFEAGHKSDGVQTIYPQGYETSVYCDMTNHGGGWTMLLNRQWQKVPENFTRNWAEYKLGFGDPAEEHWMGNEALHLMTTSKDYIMRLDAFCSYGHPRNIWGEFNFKVASEDEKYRLSIERNDTMGSMDRTYKGGIFVPMNGHFFTTYDRDNDGDDRGNCAASTMEFGAFNEGGFWHNICLYISPTATYGGMLLAHWSTTMNISLYADAIEMKLRPQGKQFSL